MSDKFKLSEKFRSFKELLESPFITDPALKENYVDDTDPQDIIASFLTDEFIRLGYENSIEKYIEVSNIDAFSLHAWLEVDDYASQLEFNIEKVYVNLTLLDFDEKLWFEGQPEEEKELWKTFRSFDTRPEIGDGKMGVFSIQEGVSPPAEPAIYYIDRAFYCKTSLTFVQYYEALLDMMGIADWQILFSDVSLKDPMISYKYDGLNKSLQALAKAFPEKDYTKYFELLEDKWTS